MTVPNNLTRESQGLLMARLKDMTQIGTPAETARVLLAMAEHFLATCDWIRTNVERTDSTIALFNILRASAEYLQVTSHNIEGHVSVLALATRSLYELNLRVQHNLISENNMQIWLSEIVTDKIQVLERIIQFDTDDALNRQRAILQSEVIRLKKLRQKYKLPEVSRSLDSRSIARKLGSLNDHDALFKLSSKLVHPSSYLTNDQSTVTALGTEVILEVYAQVYAWDIFRQVCDALSVPDSVREISGNLRETYSSSSTRET
jgi:hypothetical protein